MRVNLSVALAVMVANHTVMRDGKQVQESAEFTWNTTTQGLILSAFYYGYIVMQIPGGYLARKLGGATMIGVAVGSSGALTLLTPLAARTHVGMLIALRVTMGLTEGSLFPSGHALWSKWAPPLERSELGSVDFVGEAVGIIISMFLSGYLAYHFGWSSIFYVFGITGVIWSLTWLLMVRNSPSEQLWISKEEVEYIELSLAGDLQSKDVPIPWKAIFTSLPVWAITVAHFTHAWGTYTMLSELPLFYTQRFHFGLRETSIASSVPYVVNNVCSTGAVRKIFLTLGFISPAVLLITLSYLTNFNIVLALITMAVGVNGLSVSGFAVNHLDIAPPLASVLLGITNTAATVAGIFTPTLTGIIVQHHTALEWRIVFFINGGIYLLGSTFYVVFGSGEKQPWATTNEYDKLADKDSDGDGVGY
ncbi:hypothetical protein ACROYT_G018496 [Oculina patagonica]